jgi:hypothetical protein
MKKYVLYCSGFPIPQEISLDLSAIEDTCFIKALQVDFTICNECQVARRALIVAPGSLCADLNMIMFVFLYAKTHPNAPQPSHTQFYAFLDRVKTDPALQHELVEIVKRDNSISFL